MPLCVTLMVLAEPILGVWLGDRYTGGATALTILVAYWLLYGALVVTPGFLVGAGRAPQVARLMVVLAVRNLALALRAHARARAWRGRRSRRRSRSCSRFPLMLRNGLLATGVSVSELVRRAFAPGLRSGRRARGGSSWRSACSSSRPGWPPSASWPSPVCWRAGPAFYLLVFDEGERALVKSLLRPVRDEAGERER